MPVIPSAPLLKPANDREIPVNWHTLVQWTRLTRDYLVGFVLISSRTIRSFWYRKEPRQPRIFYLANILCLLQSRKSLESNYLRTAIRKVHGYYFTWQSRGNFVRISRKLIDIACCESESLREWYCAFSSCVNEQNHFLLLCNIFHNYAHR